MLKITKCFKYLLLFPFLSLMLLAHAQPPTLPITYLSWSPTGERLLASRYNLIQIFTAENSELYREFIFETNISAPTWGPDETQIAFGECNGATVYQNIYIYSIDNNVKERVNRGIGTCAQTNWSPNGDWLLESFIDGDESLLVDMTSGSKRRLELRSISTSSWSPDGDMIAIFDLTHLGPYIYTIPDFTLVATGANTLLDSHITLRYISRWRGDNQQLAAGRSDGRIIIWSINNPHSPSIYFGHDLPQRSCQGACECTLVDSPYCNNLYAIQALHYDASGRYLTSVAGDGTIRTWDTRTGTVINEQFIYPISAADFSPDGAYLAVAPLPFAPLHPITIDEKHIRYTDNGAIAIIALQSPTND